MIGVNQLMYNDISKKTVKHAEVKGGAIYIDTWGGPSRARTLAQDPLFIYVFYIVYIYLLY